MARPSRGFLDGEMAIFYGKMMGKGMGSHDETNFGGW